MTASETVHAYPRPQLVRENWTSLNGQWQFALDSKGAWDVPSEVTWDRTIIVPFSPETRASGVGDTGFYRAVWYRRTFTPLPLKEGERLILHFGAVDYRATVWVNDTVAVRHTGGYTPFQADITSYITASGPQTVVVRAEDDP